MSSAYPNGFAAGVTIRGVPLLSTNPGEVFWVNGSGVLAKGGVGGSNGNPGTYRQPFATIDYAVGKCTASRGDIIVVMPGHSEDIAAATSLVVDVIGVAIIGLGSGALRPDLNFSATGGIVTVSAADVTFYNLTLTADVSAVVVGVNVDANGFTMDNCEWNFNATGDDFLKGLDVDTVSDFVFTNNKVYSEEIAGGTSAIRLDTVTQYTIANNHFSGFWTTGVIFGETGASSGALIDNNLLYNADTAGGECIEINTADTGLCTRNLMGTLLDASPDQGLDPGSLLCNLNYVVNNINESGILNPPALST